MKPIVVIISGLAGSGKTLALRALEDEGFFCVDNLPVTLIESFVSIITSDSHNTRIGMGIDIREKEFLPAIDSVLGKLRENYTVEIIFLEAEKDALIRRFKETRRPHPLVSDDVTLESAIDSEKALLLPLRREAGSIIDTSTYTPHQLRHMVSSLYRMSEQNAAMTITLISFGHKFGIPQNIDLLFDVRFIPNPYFITALRDLNGTDKEVQDFVLGNSVSQDFLKRTAEFLNFLIPHYIKEGKSYLTVGFGCTGGKHRSPVIVEKIAPLIKDHPVSINIIHRDITT